MARDYERSLPRETRKARGIFYTPGWIVEFIAARAVRPGDSVLDPACGAGAFLAAARKMQASVYGIDADAAALAFAAQAEPGATLSHGDALLDPWPEGFPRQFDAVIGNPPYLSVDDYGLNTHALRERFPHVYRDKTDLAFYFLALAVEFAARSIGLIMPRAFLEAYKADKLRRYLAGHVSIREIVDFQHYRVFPDAGVSTCIVILEKGAGEGTLRRLVKNELPHTDLAPLVEDPAIFESVPIREPGAGPWVFVPDPVRDLNAKVDAAGVPAGEILVVGQGMQTGRNSVFGRRSREEHLSAPALYRKRATNTDIQRFQIRDRGEYVLYLEDVPSFDDLPAGVQSHLLAHEQELKSRAAYRRGDCEWWKFTWPLHKELYGRKKILCPYLAQTNRFALDENGEFIGLTDTTVLFDNGQPEELRYIAAILNSRLLTFRHRTIGKLKSCTIREYFWNGVSRLPVRRAVGNPLARLAEGGDMDAAVYQLYDLTPAEVRLVESQLPALF